MPSTGTVISNVFAAQAGPLPLAQLDANFTTAVGASNTLLNFSNYFVDSSGAANSVTVTVPSPLIFSYIAGVGLQVKIANTNSSATVTVNVNSLGNKSIINNDGSALVVGQFPVNSILSLIYDGASFRLQSQSKVGLFPDGSASLPSISFSSDNNTGLYHASSDVLVMTAGGTAIFAITATSASVQSNLPLLCSDGLVSAPGISFNNDTDTGIFLSGTNTIGFSCGGVIKAAVNGSGLFQFSSGASTTPSITFLGDVGIGLYHNAADSSLGVTIGGASAIQINGISTTGVRTATFSATNKPGSGTAGPISWLPVLTAGGIQGWIPIFG